LVFDFAGQNLYISSSTGIIQTFKLSTLAFGTSYDLGGSLRGLDAARDDSFLLVAQNAYGIAEGTFQKVSLPTGLVTNIRYGRSLGGDAGGWDVAIGSNGLALVTTQALFIGCGSPLRQIDLATNIVSIRHDDPGCGALGAVAPDTQIHRSADGTRFFVREGNFFSDGNIFTYSASNNTFGQGVETFAETDASSGAVDRSGNLVAFRKNGNPASLYTPPNLDSVHSFGGIDGGVAFDAISDTFYGVNSATDQIIAYSTQTFLELFRLNIGEDMPAGSTPFETGPLVASADGHWLALGTPSGVRLFYLSSSIPSPTPTGTPVPIPSPTSTPASTATPSATPTAPPTATPSVTPGHLGNISTRLRVETDDNVLIGGFIVTGTQPKRVIVRAIGPSLTGTGIPGALANPTLELRDGNGALLRSNDDWMDAPNHQEIIDSTLAPTNDLESAILLTLPANNSVYTATVRGVSGGTGVGLVEAYDLDLGANSLLANISTRGLVQTDDNVMIGGFIVVGNTPKRVIVRAIGPSLTTVPNRLANPTLELRNGNGTLLQANDDWMDAPNRQEIIDSTLAPTDDLESAILMTLPAGNSSYTAIVRGVNGTTGVALVEAYSLQ
jgi:hypothetical protein